MSSEVQKDSIISKKAYAFALEIIKVYKQLLHEKKEFGLSKQLIRSGTSVGATINEAISGQSKRDFVHKLSIVLKEARETSYWLSLLHDSDYITKDDFSHISGLCDEIVKILSSISLTTKERYFKPSTHNS